VSATPLRVLSLNLWHDAGPWKRRAACIRAWIARLEPDLIGFQEVLRGEAIDLAAELLEGTEYHFDFVAASPFWRERALHFGNAVATRWPIIERDELRLPESGDGETRAALSVRIDSPLGPISFTCTHLNWKLHQAEVRCRQVAALCEHVLRHRPKGGFPPLVVGDFNAEPDSDEIRFMTGLHSIDGKSVYFHDAWRVAGEGEQAAGTTWSNRNPYARANHEPDRRIDYVFAGYPLPSGVGLIERCRVVCDDAHDGVWPSDHFGVYAELRSAPRPD